MCVRGQQPLWPSGYTTSDVRHSKMPRLAVSDANGNSEQQPPPPVDVVANGQFSLHSVHPSVGYPLSAGGHFPHPHPTGVGEVKPEYITNPSGEPHTTAAAAFTPSLG